MVARAVRVDIGNVTGTFYGARTASLAEIEVIASGDIDAVPPPEPSEDDDSDGSTLSIVALVVGGLGVLVGGTALVAGGRRSRAPHAA